MRECEAGLKPEDQQNCQGKPPHDYEPTDSENDNWRCFKFRELSKGFYICNGMRDRTKDKPKTEGEDENEEKD